MGAIVSIFLSMFGGSKGYTPVDSDEEVEEEAAPTLLLFDLFRTLYPRETEGQEELFADVDVAARSYMDGKSYVYMYLFPAWIYLQDALVVNDKKRLHLHDDGTEPTDDSLMLFGCTVLMPDLDKQLSPELRTYLSMCTANDAKRTIAALGLVMALRIQSSPLPNFIPVCTEVAYDGYKRGEAIIAGIVVAPPTSLPPLPPRPTFHRSIIPVDAECDEAIRLMGQFGLGTSLKAFDMNVHLVRLYMKAVNGPEMLGDVGRQYSDQCSAAKALLKALRWIDHPTNAAGDAVVKGAEFHPEKLRLVYEIIPPMIEDIKRLTGHQPILTGKSYAVFDYKVDPRIPHPDQMAQNMAYNNLSLRDLRAARDQAANDLADYHNQKGTNEETKRLENNAARWSETIALFYKQPTLWEHWGWKGGRRRRRRPYRSSRSSRSSRPSRPSRPSRSSRHRRHRQTKRRRPM